MAIGDKSVGAVAPGAYPHPQSSPAGRFGYRALKRAMDLMVCLLVLPLWLPVFVAVYLLVRWTSPGPGLFRHRRLGRGGTFFTMWKFRTMSRDSEEILAEYLAANPEAQEEWLHTRKLRRDPRVTALGRVLRRYSLDELPQLWNVLRGEMSLVGPRPIVSAEVESYHQCFDCYCAVKPGVTGLWQVSGRNRVSYTERVALDCRYVREWSLAGDTRILLRTVLCIVNHDEF
jgi:lipopolysaccharide/colanic/teichoic acid biosynthesis glycosyltransferase